MALPATPTPQGEPEWIASFWKTTPNVSRYHWGGVATDFNAAVQAAKKRYAGLFKRLVLKQQWELTSEQGHRLPLQNVFPPAKQ